MQLTTLALAAAIFIFVLYTTIMSFKNPHELIKLKYMRAKLGLTKGTLLHSIVYIIVPLIFGLFVLNAAIDGVTISEFITGKKQY